MDGNECCAQQTCLSSHLFRAERTMLQHANILYRLDFSLHGKCSVINSLLYTHRYTVTLISYFIFYWEGQRIGIDCSLVGISCHFCREHE